MLLPRILTALVGIPIVMLCIYAGGLSFFFMFFAVIIFSVMEYYSICKKYNPMNILGTLTAALFYVSLYLNLYVQEVIIFSTFLIFFASMLKNRIKNVSSEIAVTCFGAFFLTWSLYHMVLIRDIPNYGMKYIIFLFVTVWILDTGAYIIGKKFGKHKLARFISPKKTVEGAIAGIITSIITAIVCRQIFMQNIISINEAVIFALIISVAGQFSDLAESLFKRDCDIKDSGNILPGHGGMLDRFDSYIFCAPIFYYLIIFIKR
ncbi:MAG: phosphatidate cytidylyltransferase [Endomicrobiaceae bacterium]